MSGQNVVSGVYIILSLKRRVELLHTVNLSLLHSAPELLLLGLTPGSAVVMGKNSLRKNFLQGNPEYHTKGSWTMWQRQCRLFAQGNMLEMLQDEGSCVGAMSFIQF